MAVRDTVRQIMMGYEPSVVEAMPLQAPTNPGITLDDSLGPRESRQYAKGWELHLGSELMDRLLADASHPRQVLPLIRVDDIGVQS